MLSAEEEEKRVGSGQSAGKRGKKSAECSVLSIRGLAEKESD